MNLVIDIGNTAAKIAVFEGEELKEIAYSPNHSLEALKEISEKYPLTQGIIASVITLTSEMLQYLRMLDIRLIQLTSETPIPVNNLYKTPKTLGADRLAAVIAAHTLSPQHDALVIDAGTCITYDYIDANGNYLGGNISPGISMRLKAMHAFTDKLPLIPIEGEIPSWGNSTETAIRAGAIQGVQMEIEGYIQSARQKNPHLFVFLTGGDSFYFDTPRKNSIFADKFLVLKGLNRILNYNDTHS